MIRQGYNKKKFIHTFTIFCENYLRTFKFTVDEDEKYENFDTLTKKGEAFISDDQERLVKIRIRHQYIWR